MQRSLACPTPPGRCTPVPNLTIVDGYNYFPEFDDYEGEEYEEPKAYSIVKTKDNYLQRDIKEEMPIGVKTEIEDGLLGHPMATEWVIKKLILLHILCR